MCVWTGWITLIMFEGTYKIEIHLVLLFSHVVLVCSDNLTEDIKPHSFNLSFIWNKHVDDTLLGCEFYQVYLKGGYTWLAS